MIKSIDRKTNRVILSYKETLGTGEENVKILIKKIIPDKNKIKLAIL